MFANFPSRLSISIFMFMKSFKLAFRNGVHLIIFDSQRLKSRLIYDWTIYNCYCFFKLTLISQLIMQIYTRKKDVELRVRMYPSQCQDIVLNLCFKSCNFISHIAMILMTLLSRHNQMRYNKPVLFFSSTKKCARFKFVGSV